MGKERSGSAGVYAVTLVAGILMVMSGIFHAQEGLIALRNGSFYVLTPKYAFGIDVTVWGWIHLLLGILVAVAGVCLLLGQRWARIAAIAAAMLSAIASFLFIPYDPALAIVVLAFDIAVIWVLTVHGGEVFEPGDMPGGKSR
jgi:hypothetical protein